MICVSPSECGKEKNLGYIKMRIRLGIGGFLNLILIAAERGEGRLNLHRVFQVGRLNLLRIFPGAPEPITRIFPGAPEPITRGIPGAPKPVGA